VKVNTFVDEKPSFLRLVSLPRGRFPFQAEHTNCPSDNPELTEGFSEVLYLRSKVFKQTKGTEHK